MAGYGHNRSITDSNPFVNVVMSINCLASTINLWVQSVRGRLVPLLKSDARFQGSNILISRFEHEVNLWNVTRNIRPLIEIGNELASAEALLNGMGACETLIYEPPIPGTKKRIDFLKVTAHGINEWIEVKTVSPRWEDNDERWQRALKFTDDFPKNASLTVNKDWDGAAIANKAINARMSFIERTHELELRVKLIPTRMAGSVSLMLCSSGTEWHLDDLQDFIEFYRTGRSRPDDWFRNAAKRFMDCEGISFDGSLSGFHLLNRKPDAVSSCLFQLYVS